MPRMIRISNSKQRDATIEVFSPKKRERLRYQDPAGRLAVAGRLIKATEGHTLEDLLSKHGDLAEVANALVEGDPEIDFELLGRKTGEVDRVYIGSDGSVLYSAQVLEVQLDPAGREIDRHDFVDVEPSVGEEILLAWNAKALMPTDQVVRKFAFVRHLQLRHKDGVTFDFLYGIAEALSQAKSMLLVRSPAKHAKGRLIFQRNGSPYFGFLEGRVEGDAYLLVLHLSNLELKKVAP